MYYFHNQLMGANSYWLYKTQTTCAFEHQYCRLKIRQKKDMIKSYSELEHIYQRQTDKTTKLYLHSTLG